MIRTAPCEIINSTCPFAISGTITEKLQITVLIYSLTRIISNIASTQYVIDMIQIIIAIIRAVIKQIDRQSQSP